MVYSIINKSKLEGAYRLDAEYYQPEYLEIERKLNSIHTKPLDEISESVISFGAYSLTNYIEWQESGVPYLNVENIRNGYIEFDGVKFISEKVDEILNKSRVKEGQVIITMAGTIGEVAVAHKIPKKVNSNQATAKITLKKDFSPYYLAAFLNSYYGREQTDREIVSSVQPNIFLGQIKNFKVPLMSTQKQREIEEFYKKYLDELEFSKSFYHQAENLLLEELGLNDFQIEDNLSFVVNLSEVKEANRIDAEYFQPKYEKLVARLKAQNAKQLGELVSMKKGVEPGSEAYEKEGKLFIRVSSLSKFRIDQTDQKYLSEDLYQKLKINYEPKVGEILLTKDATPGIAYVLKEPVEGIISGGIVRLKGKPDIDPEYLALCINSIIGKMQAERDAGGSVIMHWKPEQIRNILIPILPRGTQQKIAELVRKSHEARKRSKELLEEAKRKVENHVERGRND